MSSSKDSSNNFQPFSLLREDLQLHIAAFLPPQDLLHYQCVSKELASLNTDSIWKKRCQKRWQPWPRFRLTEEKHDELDQTLPNTSWQQRYISIEQEATRTELRASDLQNLQWYLSFVLSGIRGEGRSDHMKVSFTAANLLVVPGHPPLFYRIFNLPPPPSDHIRQTLRGDRPFSTTQYLKISDFPAHFIARKANDAEWLIVNENVMMVSSKE